MSAICFKCGTEKQGALVPCGSCAALPKTQTELLLSLMFSEHLASKAQLANFSHEIRNHLKLTIPPDLIEQAKEALRDPQLMGTIGMRPTSAAPKPSNPSIPTSQERPADDVASPAATSRRRRSLKSTSLHQNPFALLGATTRDDRRRIVDLAEERALQIDHDVCQKARADLTGPRTRLALEMAWMPGVSPRRASQMLQTVLDDPMSIREASGLPTLALLNLMAAAFEAVDAQDDAEEVAEFIQEVAYLADTLSVDDVLRDINEDRSVSGFPEIRAPEQIEAELAERKRYFRNAIKDGLNRLPPAKLLTAMTSAVESATNGGEDHAPELLDELVDSYAVEAQGFLQKEAENVHKLIKATRESAKAGESAVKVSIAKLETVTRNWEQVARPIQVSAKARGTTHRPSAELALSIRGLAIDLFNEHGLLGQAQHLTDLVGNVFSDMPEVSVRIEEDAKALGDISQRREEASAIDPIRSLCEEIAKSAERNPSQAQHEGQRLLDEGKALLKAVPIKATSPTYLEARDLLAATLMHCAVAYGNETSKWEPCIRLLQAALEFSNDPNLKQKLRENLAIVEGNYKSLGDLEPIKAAPSLYTINGFGVTLYGNTDKNPSDGSYMATYYLVLLFIPVLPIARYRVIPTGGGYRFLGKGPLRPFDKWHIAISIGLIVLMFLKG